MKAELIDQMGSDLRVVNAARVSFDKESEFIDYDEALNYDPQHRLTGLYEEYMAGDKEKYLSFDDFKLLYYLSDHNHWTPFSHPQITMRETVPIFVARQRFKHMVGFTYNEVSRRYVDDTPEFYIPEGWRHRSENKKQGSEESFIDHNESAKAVYQLFLDKALELYHELLFDGVAPEQARMVLPQSMYTSYYVTGSLAAWARAYKQRIDPHAQKEIQDLAKQWDTIIRPLYPVSWKALVDEQSQI